MRLKFANSKIRKIFGSVTGHSLITPTALVIKMCSLNVKRPKCSSKLVVMASLTFAVLIVFAVLVFFAKFSLENGEKVYASVYKGE